MLSREAKGIVPETSPKRNARHKHNFLQRTMKRTSASPPPADDLARLKKFKKGKKSLTLYLDVKTHTQFKAKAREHNRTMSAQLNHFIMRFLSGEIQG